MLSRFTPARVLRAAIARLRRNLNLFADWRDTYLWTARREVTTPYGFKLLAGHYNANRAMQLGTFEPQETALLQKHLQTADVFVDVGANIGFYACLARQMGKPVVAIEPQRRNLECLYANLNNNGWHEAEVYPMGVSKSPGLLTLYGATGTGASLIQGWAGYSARFRQIIPVSTLDILLGERMNGKQLVIKVDVEGAEFAVLQGSLQTLTLSPPPIWMIEICLNEYYPTGFNPNYYDTFALFWKHGYEARTADENNRIVSPADVERWLKIKQCDSGVINYVFTPSL